MTPSTKHVFQVKTAARDDLGGWDRAIMCTAIDSKIRSTKFLVRPLIVILFLYVFGAVFLWQNLWQNFYGEMS